MKKILKNCLNIKTIQFCFVFQNGTWEQIETGKEKDEDKAETGEPSSVKVNQVRFGSFQYQTFLFGIFKKF